MAPHVFTEPEFLSADAADVQVDIHVFLQLLPAREDLEAHLADGLAGRQVRDHVSDVVVLEEGALIAERTHVARHSFVHVGVQAELALSQELLAAGLAGELLLLGVDGVVLPQVAALVEAFSADAAEMFPPVVGLAALVQRHGAVQVLVVAGQSVL